MLRRALVLGGLFAVVAVVGSVAWATTSAGDKFVACAKKSGGALRLVSAAKDCRKTERAVTWSTKAQPGPRGPVGPRGVAGEDGEDGFDGDDGLDGDDGDDGVDGIDGDDGVDGAPGPATKFHYVYGVTPATIPVGPSTIVSSEICPGTVPLAVNGGIKVDGLATTVRVRATAPKGSGATPTQWEAEVENTGAQTTVTSWVLCTNGTPSP
jgi:hypothetical protein